MNKHTIYRRISLFALCIFIWVCAFAAQCQVLNDLQSNFASYQKNNLHEKVYVHLNKNDFLTGELIWFKIFCVDGSNNKPLDMSKVAYVEVLDNKNVAVVQAKVALKNGAGDGSLVLSSALGSGSYRLRAYTNWMRNFDPAWYFSQDITIINTNIALPAATHQDSNNYDVQFFPEGGHLVQGLSSKIAFKITAADGLGARGNGFVIGPQNDTVARFATHQFGIGSFSFKPLAQTGYKAIIYVGNRKITKGLPEISANGITEQASLTGTSWDVHVQTNGYKPAHELYLIVHSSNKITCALKGTLVNGEADFSIGNNKLSEGISYITLFDGPIPVCERLIFKKPEQKLLINATTETSVYHSREKVNLDIGIKNNLASNDAANLSVSVYRLDSLQKLTKNNIAGYLWLAADVKGFIESPDYYLDTDDNEALDNLLIAQGWTQFDWTKISGNSPKINYLPEYQGPLISGKLTNNLTNAPAINISTYLTITGKHHQLHIAKSDSTGNILFAANNFYGPAEIVVQTNWLRDSTYRIDINNPYSEEYDPRPHPLFHVESSMHDLLTAYHINVQVQRAFMGKAIEQFESVTEMPSIFYGAPSFSYNLDDYTRFPSTREVIFEYVRLVRINSANNQTSFQLVADDKTILPGNPLVLLDSKPIFDGNRVLKIDPLKIKSLDVVTHNYIYGPEVLNGILSFKSYDGASINTELDPRAVVLDFEGLQLQRKFYSPVYESKQQHDSPLADFRNVLYWNPNINTWGTGTKLSFYTGDKTGKYVGVIEGIAANGEAGSKYFYFDVTR